MSFVIFTGISRRMEASCIVAPTTKKKEMGFRSPTMKKTQCSESYRNFSQKRTSSSPLDTAPLTWEPSMRQHL